MQDRIAFLVEKLNLIPHPEGGYFSETYRSEMNIDGGNRQLMTAIYFLLTSENVSKFHRIKSDEIWFYHEGSSLIVHSLHAEGHKMQKVGLDINAGEKPQYLVSKNTIFGSTVCDIDSYSLVSCVVAPGFDFRDFELFSKEELISIYPSEIEIINQLT
ncbi:MAG: cupin domain-containing protein [Flavobacteriia bacterium]|nr:cupin domain-containing protein [Flavobacteriia bacterium]